MVVWEVGGMMISQELLSGESGLLSLWESMISLTCPICLCTSSYSDSYM